MQDDSKDIIIYDPYKINFAIVNIETDLDLDGKTEIRTLKTLNIFIKDPLKNQYTNVELNTEFSYILLNAIKKLHNE